MYKNQTNLRSRSLVLTMAMLTLTAVGCGGGSGSGSKASVLTAGLSSSFSPSGTSPSADTVRLAGSTSGSDVTVFVTISGPTTSTDLYSFAFDLVLGEEGIFDLLANSANFGSALSLSGGQQGQVLAVQNGDRITVGVSKSGGGPGNGIAAGDSTVVTLTLRAGSPGTTTLMLEGSPPNDPSALDSAGAEIPSVVFDGSPAVLTAL